MFKSNSSELGERSHSATSFFASSLSLCVCVWGGGGGGGWGVSEQVVHNNYYECDIVLYMYTCSSHKSLNIHDIILRLRIGVNG